MQVSDTLKIPQACFSVLKSIFKSRDEPTYWVQDGLRDLSFVEGLTHSMCKQSIRPGKILGGALALWCGADLINPARNHYTSFNIQHFLRVPQCCGCAWLTGSELLLTEAAIGLLHLNSDPASELDIPVPLPGVHFVLKWWRHLSQIWCHRHRVIFLQVQRFYLLLHRHWVQQLSGRLWSQDRMGSPQPADKHINTRLLSLEAAHVRPMQTQ